MVEKRASDSTQGEYSQPTGQERLTAVARLIEMAKDVGVDMPAGASLDQIQDALLHEETFLQE